MEAADGGLYVVEATRGALDPFSGVFSLDVPYAHRVRGGELAEIVGGFRLRGRVAELFGAVIGVGSETAPAGAGSIAESVAVTPRMLRSVHTAHRAHCSVRNASKRKKRFEYGDA